MFKMNKVSVFLLFLGVCVHIVRLQGVGSGSDETATECGKVTPESVQLATNGTSVKHGELPWHVCIYTKRTKPYMQICGGSIVSAMIVISAAHCFGDDESGKRDAKDFAVAAGKIYRNYDEEGDEKFAQKYDVSDIKIPSTYYGGETNYDYDLALVFTARPFVYKPYIRPVCLSFDLRLESDQLKDGNYGKVAGWSFTGRNDNASQVLKVVDLHYISQGDCLARTPPGFRDHLTSQKFCAGNEDGKTLSRGEGGGGLVFSSLELGIERFYLRGIASTAINRNNTDDVTTFSHVTKMEAYIKSHLPPFSLLSKA